MAPEHRIAGAATVMFFMVGCVSTPPPRASDVGRLRAHEPIRTATVN